MQLKNLGNSVNAVKEIQNTLDFMANFKGLQNKNDTIAKLIETTSKYNVETLKLASSQVTLSTAQAKGIFSAKNLEGAELDAAIKTATLSASQKGATASTGTLGTAFKGLGASIANATKSSIAFLAANPILAVFAGAAALIAGVSVAIDAFTTSTEEAREQAEKSAQELSDLQSEISSINSELESTGQKIDEILAKDKIELSDEEELKKLQAQNDELERELRIKEALEKQSKKEASDDATEVFTSVPDNGFWKMRGTTEFYQETRGAGGVGEFKDVDRDRMQASIDYMEQLVALNKELIDLKSKQDSTTVGSTEFQVLDNQIRDKKKLIEAVQNELDSNIKDFQSEDDNLVSGISEETDIVLAKLDEIYEKYDILMNYTDGKAITLDERFNEKFSHVDGLSDWANSLTDDEKKLLIVADIDEEASLSELKAFLNREQTEEELTLPLSISDTITQLDIQLRPALEALKKSYQDIFSDGKFILKNVDVSILAGIKSQLESLGKELNVEIDHSSFEDFASVLNDTESTEYDVQKAFNELATTITNTALSGVEDFETLKAALEDFGIENSELVAFENLVGNTESLKKAGLDLATASEAQIIAFANEVVSAENVAQAIDMLTFAKLSADAANMDTSTEVANLRTLAENAGYTGDVIKYLTELEQIYQGITSGTIPSADIPEKLERAKELTALIQSSANNINYEPKFNGNSGKSSASKAGKEAADAYLEAFEKELQKLDDLKSQGKISEKQYLDALRRLYVKYFNQKKKYLDQYEKYESQYLQGMKSLYESAFSYITKQIDKRINALNDEKDAAVSSLEAERDARLEAIELQKEQLENEIDGIEKQIKAKEKEIKALQDANAERKQSINLQKAEHDLERMQNQKTSNVLTEDGFQWTPDTTGIRDAREEVTDAKLEIEISKMEKEVDLLNDQKDLLQEQIDLLDKQADAVNEYYDKLIANTEAHFASMISGLENTKSKFEELSEVFENAQMEATLNELGINMDALLAGSAEEFEKLKTAYIGILSDISRGNDGVIDQLSRLGGVSAESISYLENTKGAFENLGETTIAPLAEDIDGILESAGNLSSSASDFSESVDSISKNASNASSGISPLISELAELNRLIDELVILFGELEFPTVGEEDYVEKLHLIAEGFGKITGKCKELSQIDFSSIIGSAGSSTGGNGDPLAGGKPSDTEASGSGGFKGLATALSNAVTIIELQMANLQAALNIGNSAFSDQIAKIQNDYIPAWEKLQTRLAEIIGVGGGGNKKDSTKQNSNKKESESDSDDGSIIDIMQTGGDEVSEKLEDPWLKSFNEFATGENSVQSICKLIKEIVNEMASSIQDQCAAAAKALRDLAEQALNSSISVGGSGGNGGGKSRGGGGKDNVTDGGYKGTVGSAFADGTTGFGKIRSLPITGYKGLPSDVKNALRSEYGQPELTVYPNGKTELTTEPTMSSLPKGTVIFNEEQTNRIMNNKGKLIGNAFADGTGDGTIVTKDGQVLRSLQPGDRMYELIQKMGKMLDTGTNMFIPPTNAMTQASESMDKVTNLIKNNNINQAATVTMNGGIHLHGVQDVNSLSREINLRLPNMILQDSHRR